jgi:3-oxoacyl-[acyl-carrier protein] reductase
LQINLDGKIALITAASKGIGRAAAKALHYAGARVAICARGQKDLDHAVQDLGGVHSKEVLAMHGDIGRAAFLKSLVRETTQRLGGAIDILVCNSGGPPAGPVFGFSDRAWTEALDRNLLSAVRLSALVTPGMQKKGWGRLIFLTSTTAKEPDPGMVLSNVTRAGVAAFSKTVASEFGSFGVTANTILTGGCLTDRLYTLVQKDIQGTRKSMKMALAEISASIPVGHIATPEEFAQTILFLASPEASYVNGVSLPVDGGYSKGI